MRGGVPMHNARVPDPARRRHLRFGGTRLASSVFATRSFFTNPS
jgi:hypothetical protein